MAKKQPAQPEPSLGDFFPLGGLALGLLGAGSQNFWLQVVSLFFVAGLVAYVCFSSPWTKRWSTPTRRTAFAASLLVLALIGWDAVIEQASKLLGRASPTQYVALECRMAKQPGTMPTMGVLHMLSLFAVPAETFTGGFADHLGEPGSKLRWPIEEVPQAVYRCEMTNYGDRPLFNVSTSLRVTFSEALPDRTQLNVLHLGPTKLERDWPIAFPKIDPGSERSVVFYVTNTTPDFVSAVLPKQARHRPVGAEADATVAVTPLPVGVLTFPAQQKSATAQAAAQPEADAAAPSLLSLFMNDLKPARGMQWQAFADVEVGTHKVRVLYKIIDDLNANSKFMSFYVPAIYVRGTEPGTQTVAILHMIAGRHRQYLRDIQRNRWAELKSLGDATAESTRATAFSGRLYLYHADPLTIEQLAALTKLFRDHGANAQFRGMDYAVAAWGAIRLGDAKAPPRYEMHDNLPREVQETSKP